MKSQLQQPTPLNQQQVGVGAGNNRISSNLRQPTSFKQKPTGLGARQSVYVKGNAPLLPPSQIQQQQQQLQQPVKDNQAFAIQSSDLPQKIVQSQLPYQHVSLFIHKILGSTAQSSDSLSLLSDSLCVYIASSFLVFYDFRANRQVLIYQNTNNSKAYRALYFDKPSQRLFVGEGYTKQGEIQVFKVSQQGGDIELQMVLKGHKYGVKQIRVQGDLVVSIGDDNDKGMIVWEIKTARMLSANLMKKCDLNGVEFMKKQTDTQIQFFTYGTQSHFKLWRIKIEKDEYMTEYSIAEGDLKQDQAQTIPALIGKKLNLPNIDQSFTISKIILDSKQNDICYLGGYTQNENEKKYCLIKYNFLTGQILVQSYRANQLNELNLLDYSQQFLLVTGGSQRLQLIDKATLKFKPGQDFSFASPPQKGQLQMITQEIYDYLSQISGEETDFAYIQGVFYQQGILIQILNDGMLLFHDLDTQSLLRVLVNHWDSINDLVVKEYQESEEQLSFFTCSKDSTLRLWNTYIGDPTLMSMMPEFGSKPVENDLKRIVYLESANQQAAQANGSFIGRSSLMQNDEESQGSKCMAYNQMKNILAVGDMMGNIRIYQLSTEDQQQINQVNFIEAHEGKVIALEFSEPIQINNQYVQFLISASSDRMIHIFNALSDDYDLLQTIDAHSTSIVDIKLVMTNVGFKNSHKITQYEKQLRLYSCSTDKTLQCHRYNPAEKKFVLHQSKELNKNKIHKIQATDSSVILAKDSGLIEVKQIDTWKQTSLFQQTAQNQALSKAMLDYLNLTLSQDNLLMALHDKEKSLQIRELRQCQSLLSRFGLADHLSSICFTPDNQYLICSSLNSKDQGGGLIYIFKVEHSIPLIKQNLSKIQQQRNPDKVLIVDKTTTSQLKSSVPSEADRFDLMLQASAKQRKFTVREELFNTWAKSSQQHSVNEGSSFPNIINEVIEEEDQRVSDIQNSSKMQMRARGRVQIKPKQEEETPGSETQMRDSPNQEDNAFISDFMKENNQSNGELEFEEVPDDDLEERMIPDIEGQKNSMNLRNSFTKMFLGQTPHLSNSNQSQPPVQDLEIIEQFPSISQQSPLTLQSHPSTQQRKISFDDNQIEKENKLFKKLLQKFHKIEKIGTELEDIEMDDLNQIERAKLALAIGKALQKLGSLQMKFIEGSLERTEMK